MRGIDPRVVEVTAAFPPGTSWASGYRLSTTLVLTARHVVVSENSAAQECSLRPLGTGKFVPATVAWFSSVLDLAVLRVTADALPGVHAGSVPRWGRFEGSQSVPCRITGFPVAHDRTDDQGRQVRDPEPIEGMLKLATAAKREVIDIAIAGSVPDAVPKGSPWEGMSGAGVLCGPWLVAVVTSDPANFGPDRLSATLVESALADPSLLSLLAEENVSGQLEVADLPRALQIPYRSSQFIRAPERPGGSRARLVQPEFGVVPFAGRESELSDLAEWCASDERVSARLLTGPGGQGKTRLALELCREQAAAGWLSGLLSDHVEAPDLDAMLTMPASLLVVIDWADTQVEQVIGLTQRAISAAAGPVRLLLLARHAGEWWASLPYRARGQAGDILAAADAMSLNPLTDDVIVRREQFEVAARAFARCLDRTGQDIAEPDLSDRLFDTLLFVHLAALIAVEPPPSKTSGQIGSDLLAEVLRREDAYYWEPSAPAALRGELARTTRHRAVAVATLTAAQTEDEAREALQMLPDFAQADPTPALYWLHDLYPAQGYFGPLRPDLLGEAHVAQVVRARTDLPTLLVPDADKTWITRLLTVLAQAAGTDTMLIGPLNEILLDRLSLLVVKAQSAADASLGHALTLALKRTGSVDSARALVDQLPQTSLAMAEPAVAGLQLLLDHDHSPEYGVRLLANLSRWLGEIGRYDEAAQAGQRAVAAARDLAKAGGASDQMLLAILLVNLASALGQVDKSEEGLAAADEALTILRRDADPPSQAQESLSVALANRARCLVSLGREREAVGALEEAAAILRQLVAADTSYRPRLAGLLVQLSDLRRRWRHAEEAAATITEALDIYRELAAASPDAYTVNLASALVNASELYWSQGMGPEALTLAGEAVPICRELAKINPDRYQPWLAMVLDTEAECLMSIHGPLAALPIREETVATYRAMVQDADVYRPQLATALTSMAECLNDLGRADDALAAIDEAVTVFRQAEAAATEAGSPFAKALVSQSQVLDALNRTAEALGAIEEAARIYRVLVASRPATYHADLTDALVSQSRLLVKAGRATEALTVIDEAVSLPRSLASDQPKAFWSLYGALVEKAEQLERAGRSEEAQAVRYDAGHIQLPVGMMLKLPVPPATPDPPGD